MRVAVYHRVSTLDQDRTLARSELEAWVGRQGAEIVLRAEENASGAWNARPGLQRVLEAARKGQVDCVVVWKLDRWGRSALDVLANIQALADAGCRFVAVTQGLDVKPTGDAMSRLLLGVLAAVAEFERDLIRDRTRLGVAKARATGKVLGRPRHAKILGEKVRALRDLGMAWPDIARRLRTSASTARRRAADTPP